MVSEYDQLRPCHIINYSHDTLGQYRSAIHGVTTIATAKAAEVVAAAELERTLAEAAVAETAIAIAVLAVAAGKQMKCHQSHIVTECVTPFS